MERPNGYIETVAASATVLLPGSISLVRARTLSVTVDVLFGGSIDADAVLKVYYSPDGKNWDDLVYTSFAITYTVSVWVQRTVEISVPEHGYLAFKITNGSSADTLDGVRYWYSLQSYPDLGGGSRGLQTTPETFD